LLTVSKACRKTILKLEEGTYNYMDIRIIYAVASVLGMELSEVFVERE